MLISLESKILRVRKRKKYKMRDFKTDLKTLQLTLKCILKRWGVDEQICNKVNTAKS